MEGSVSRRAVSLSITFPVLILALVAALVLVYRGKPVSAALVAAHAQNGSSGAGLARQGRAVRELAPSRARLTASPAATGQGMTMDPPGIIDGSKEPDLIPDVVAYRLWFLAVALPPGATEVEQARQWAQLKAAGLSSDDAMQTASILATFRTSYDYLVNSYNDSVAQANQMGDDPPDVQAFLGQRDALVGTTLRALNTALSAPGMQALRSYVQGQKANMRVAEGDE
jgi:hypothetical protein